MGATESTALSMSMKPREYRVMTKQTEMTKASIIVFFLWCLLMSPTSFSAPGTADFSIFDKFWLAFRNLAVCPSIVLEAELPTCIISFVRSSVRSRPCDSWASPRIRLLLSVDAWRDTDGLLI